MACLRGLYPIEDQCLLDDFGRVSKRPWEPNLTLVVGHYNCLINSNNQVKHKLSTQGSLLFQR
jgi:hypothetical protein